jgi:hypothetical protein
MKNTNDASLRPASCYCLSTLWLVLTLFVSTTLPASAANGQFIAHNTPPYVSTAKNVGTEDASKTIEVSVWLNPHNRDDMDAVARELYDRTSANQHKRGHF